MTKAILITGMSGTGKSSVGKYLREHGYAVHDIEDIPGMFTTTDSRTGQVLTEWDTNDVDQIEHLIFACNAAVLRDLIGKEPSPISFYCGTATNIVDIIPLFKKVILLRASPEIIRHRLSTRTTHDFARDPKMQDWILEIQKPFEESVISRGAVIVDADDDIEATVEQVLKAVSC